MSSYSEFIGKNKIIDVHFVLGLFSNNRKNAIDGFKAFHEITSTKPGGRFFCVDDWDYTKIDDYSKLDAHTHIGHATKLGKRVMVGSHCNLAGNINIEDDVYVGSGVTISNRLNICKKSKTSIGSVVTKDVSIGEVVTGNFAIPNEILIQDLKEKVKKK